MKRKASIGILSLGCPRNLVDSESILARFVRKGYPVVDIAKADIAVVNTCAFIEEAKRESIDAILDLVQLKKQGSLKKIIVHGCLAQRYRDKLKKELPQVDAFIGRLSLDERPERLAITSRHYAYLKICEGCVNSCSFCVIPQIKGKFISLDEPSILKKIEAIEAGGAFELNVIGQDITGYGLDVYGRLTLPELVDKIVRKSGRIGWIRLLYLHPQRLSAGLMDLIASSDKICKYVDIPIQHINNRILEMMNRRTDKGDILRLIDRIRKRVPGVAIRTCFIVGFPSETDREFKELLEFIRQAEFERLGAFIYSREEGTPAYDFKKQLPRRIKMERFNELMLAQQTISRRVNARFLGKTLDVLIDEKENGVYLGRSQYDAPEVDGLVYVNSKKELSPGDLVKVKISDTLEYDLAGDALN